jgi:predicted transcriptional regulator
MDELTAETDLIGMTADIVSAFVSNNAIAAGSLPRLIAGVHGALAGATQVVAPEPEPQAPAVSIRKSITPDHIICLEDGKPFKSMKRHLFNKYGLTPEDYRAKWGLPKDYPMVAPNYAAARSEMAKSMGLGQGGRKPAKRGRKPAAK